MIHYLIDQNVAKTIVAGLYSETITAHFTILACKCIYNLWFSIDINSKWYVEYILSMKLANLPHKQYVPTFRMIVYHHHAFPLLSAAASPNFWHVPTR